MSKRTQAERSTVIRNYSFYLVAAVVLAAANLMSLGNVVSTTTALYNDEAPVPGNTFSTADCFGGPDAMYVWDITFDSRTRGPGGSIHDERITVTVHQDSNANCMADGSDDPLSGAVLTIELRDQDGGPLATDSGTTGGGGTYTTGWITDLPDGTHEAWVTELSHDAYTWSPSMDAMNPGSHTIPH